MEPDGMDLWKTCFLYNRLYNPSSLQGSFPGLFSRAYVVDLKADNDALMFCLDPVLPC